jgi:hypothetical protein
MWSRWCAGRLTSGKIQYGVKDAADAGIRNVLLQQGVESPEELVKGEEFDLNLVSKKSILRYAPPVGSLQGVHRFFVNRFWKVISSDQVRKMLMINLSK